MSAAGVYFGHGTDNAIDEAAALVLHTVHLPPDLHQAYYSAALTAAEQDAIYDVFQRRIEERIPAPYLTRQAWFMGLPFYVDERVLVPRSPLAECIEAQFQPWLTGPEAVGRILDLCTGSGCIGIACAYIFSEAEVELADISADALAVAQRNINEHELNERVRIQQSDVFENLTGSYDIIITNPPYVSEQEYQGLPAEYHQEPRLGLAAGIFGLNIVDKILRQAKDYLNSEGLLIVEVGNSQQAVCEAYPEVPFIWLDFERGGEGVFLLTAEQVQNINS